MKANKYVIACTFTILASSFLSEKVYAANMCSQIFATSEASAGMGAKDLLKKASEVEADLKSGVQSYLSRTLSDRRIWSEKDSVTISQLDALMKAKDFDVHLQTVNGQFVVAGRSAEQLGSLINSLEGLKNVKGIDSNSIILYVASYKTVGDRMLNPQTFISPGHVLTFLRAEYGLQYFGANGLSKDPNSAEFLTARLNVLNQDLYAMRSLSSEIKQTVNRNVSGPQGVTHVETQLDGMIKAVDQRFSMFQDNGSKKVTESEHALQSRIQSYLVKAQSDRRIWSEKDSKTISQIESLMKSKDFDVHLQAVNGQFVAAGRSAEQLGSLINSLEGLKNVKGIDSNSIILYVASYKTVGDRMLNPQTFISPGHVLTFLRAEYGLQYFGANGLSKDPNSAEFVTARLYTLNTDLYAIQSLKVNINQIKKGHVVESEHVAQLEKQLDGTIETVNKRFEIFKD